MGAYVYTLRKQSRTILNRQGERERVQLFSYAYKPCFFGETSRAEALREAAADAAADRAHEAYDGGLVVVAGAGESMHGAAVYRDLTSGRWTDSRDFPGKLDGYLHNESGSRFPVLRSVSPWDRFQVSVRQGSGDEIAVEIERRTYVQPDGSTVEQCRAVNGEDADLLAQIAIPGRLQVIT